MSVNEALAAQGGVLTVAAFVCVFACAFLSIGSRSRVTFWLGVAAVVIAVAALASFIAAFWVGVTQ